MLAVGVIVMDRCAGPPVDVHFGALCALWSQQEHAKVV